MFYVYVIKSGSSDKIYIGQTVDIEKRIRQHNDPGNNFSVYTKKNKGPWELVYKEEVETRRDALTREKNLKSSRGRSYIRTLL